jgi:DNA-binding transcriptional regulator LsrR (DeoR family)
MMARPQKREYDRPQEMKLFGERTTREIARALGLSRSRVARALKAIMPKYRAP